MPGRDGTGPMGRGAMSGRGLGVCNGAKMGGYGAGFGMGAGFGCRRGFGRFFAGEPFILSDKEILTEQKELLQKRLDMISKQLENMSEVNR